MIKKIVLVFLLFSFSLFTLYLIFLTVISISIGLTNTDRAGFWMPILYGLLVFCLTTFIIRLIIYIFKHIRGKDGYPFI